MTARKDWPAIVRQLYEIGKDVPMSGPGDGGQMLAFSAAMKSAHALAVLIAAAADKP